MQIHKKVQVPKVFFFFFSTFSLLFLFFLLSLPLSFKCWAPFLLNFFITFVCRYLQIFILQTQDQNVQKGSKFLRYTNWYLPTVSINPTKLLLSLSNRMSKGAELKSLRGDQGLVLCRYRVTLAGMLVYFFRALTSSQFPNS